ncbi:putative fmn-binding split barrel-related protein [Neofusicoccum parvum UCRNP2]|uniref:Putative fmn-binding split barrel-related protein n=1 Tax=Botryosphaeria parva (strain UCR-NP2) TaxID=1287680 RepID=R1EC29_BOTPV|nr:putative fmn-binding split barrel-related protein [Neofusicoccum parvum UCRNP2]
MYLPHALAATLAAGLAGASLVPPPQSIFANPEAGDVSSYRIPTVHESAVMARRILHLNGLGTLSTIFPGASAQENRPSGVAGTPIGLVDYIADCEHSTGNPTILAIDIATSFKNVAAGSNISLGLNWVPPTGQVRSPASLPRYSLQGYLEPLSAQDLVQHAIPACFAKYHPDSVAWYPGSPIHSSHWVRFVVQDVYWIGGFGDRAYIGWIPVEEWRNVTRQEVRDCVLPGEEKRGGWREWLGFGRSWEL